MDRLKEIEGLIVGKLIEVMDTDEIELLLDEYNQLVLEEAIADGVVKEVL